METARNALDLLSSDPDTRRLVEEREKAQCAYQHYIASAFEEGEARGKAAGEARGELKGAVRTACEFLNIELDEAKERQLSTLEVAPLKRLLERLKSERQWPRDF